jgi:hypothetical protein
MPTPPSAYLRERRRRQHPAASGQPTGHPRPEERRATRRDLTFPADGMSILRLAGLILLVEVVYVSALAFAVPHGTGAVALAFVATFLLATVISHRVGRFQPTTTNQSMATNFKTREPQRPVPSVTRQRCVSDPREGSDGTDPPET